MSDIKEKIDGILNEAKNDVDNKMLKKMVYHIDKLAYDLKNDVNDTMDKSDWQYVEHLAFAIKTAGEDLKKIAMKAIKKG